MTTLQLLAARVAAFRRDVAMLRDGLAGRHPAPFTVPPLPALDPRAQDAARLTAALAARALRIARVTRETADAVTLELADPSGAPVPFVAGQFFTLLLSVDGEHLRRAYSASSSPLDPKTVAITCKRIAGGKASTWLNEHAREGMLLEVLGPSGSFVVPPAGAEPRDLVLLAGGSGVTPMMAILRATLATEPAARLVLVYGNRREGDVIFREELARIAAAHPGRVFVRHVLSDPPAGWTGGAGLLDAAACTRELDAAERDLATALRAPEYFVCGPEPMMIEARRALEARGVPAARIHEERFVQPHLRKAPVVDTKSAPAQMTLRKGGRERALAVKPGQTMLEAGLEGGQAMEFSCAMGGCGACKVKLVSGEVEMEEPNCLTAEERAGGYVLACVGRPKGAVVVEAAS